MEFKDDVILIKGIRSLKGIVRRRLKKRAVSVKEMNEAIA